MSTAEARPRILIGTHADVLALMVPLLGTLVVEEVWVLPLNARNELVGKPLMLSRGGTAACDIPVGPLMRLVLSRPTATAFVLVHNHPTGNPTPSPDDLTVTRKIIQAAALLDLAMVDHCIIGGEECASIRTTHSYLWIMPPA